MMQPGNFQRLCFLSALSEWEKRLVFDAEVPEPPQPEEEKKKENEGEKKDQQPEVGDEKDDNIIDVEDPDKKETPLKKKMKPLAERFKNAETPEQKAEVLKEGMQQVFGRMGEFLGEQAQRMQQLSKYYSKGETIPVRHGSQVDFYPIGLAMTIGNPNAAGYMGLGRYAPPNGPTTIPTTGMPTTGPQPLPVGPVLPGNGGSSVTGPGGAPGMRRAGDVPDGGAPSVPPGGRRGIDRGTPDAGDSSRPGENIGTSLTRRPGRSTDMTPRLRGIIEKLTPHMLLGARLFPRSQQLLVSIPGLMQQIRFEEYIVLCANAVNTFGDVAASERSLTNMMKQLNAGMRAVRTREYILRGVQYGKVINRHNKYAINLFYGDNAYYYSALQFLGVQRLYHAQNMCFNTLGQMRMTKSAMADAIAPDTEIFNPDLAKDVFMETYKGMGGPETLRKWFATAGLEITGWDRNGRPASVEWKPGGETQFRAWQRRQKGIRDRDAFGSGGVQI